MPNAQEFFNAFLKSYNEKFIETNTQWDGVWTDTYNWSNFMINNDESVIKNIEGYIGLRCHKGEPLRLDAVFTESDEWGWFPISIAIEHENNPAGLHGEINKLISIDCELKVAVTYSLLGDKSMDWVKDKIEKYFFLSLSKTNFLSSRNSEYLFIIGNELSESPQKLSWKYAICRHHSQRKSLTWCDN